MVMSVRASGLAGPSAPAQSPSSPLRSLRQVDWSAHLSPALVGGCWARRRNARTRWVGLIPHVVGRDGRRCSLLYRGRGAHVAEEGGWRRVGVVHHGPAGHGRYHRLHRVEAGLQVAGGLVGRMRPVAVCRLRAAMHEGRWVLNGAIHHVPLLGHPHARHGWMGQRGAGAMLSRRLHGLSRCG